VSFLVADRSKVYERARTQLPNGRPSSATKAAEPEGVIQRQGSGFSLDPSRVAYLRYLRRERQQSPRTEADAAHARAKTEMLQLRLMEKRRELVRRDEVNELIDGLCGVVLTALGCMPARCAPRGDLATRRNIEWVVVQGAAPRWP
jgi:hypothetical protein